MPALKDQPVPVDRLIFLRTLSATRPSGAAALTLARAMRDAYFKKRDVLFEIGQPSGDIYFVVRGSCSLVVEGQPDWHFDAPAIVGVIDSLSGKPRTRKAVATTDMHTLVLSATDWMATLEEHFEFAKESLSRVSSFLHNMRLGVPGDGAFPPPAPPGNPIQGLNLFERTIALRKVPVLKGATVQAILRLAELSSEIALDPGQQLFDEGSRCDALDIVASGNVRVTMASGALEASFGPGAIVGGASMIGTDRHAYTATAETSAAVLHIRKDDCYDVMEDHFDLMRSFLSGIGAEREAIMRQHGILPARPVRANPVKSG